MTDSQRVTIDNIMLTSLDGAIATHSGESSEKRRAGGMTNAADFEHMRGLVAKCDAVFIGWRSIASERGAFRVGDLRADGKEPLWMVFSRSGDMDLSHPFWTQKQMPRAVSFCTDWDSQDSPMARCEGRDLLGLPTDFYVGNIGGILDIARTKGIKRIALLGGGALNAHFWNAGLVDHLHLTLSPCLSGTAGAIRIVENLQERVPLQLKHTQKKGDFLFLEYAPLPTQSSRKRAT
jgi:riboflavin biosynthesis pyrimidine reductase